MAGFRAGEKIEIRPGEGRMQEIKELDRKVDPFLRNPLPIEGQVGTSFSEGTRSEGMKDFLAIGEKGATTDLKDNANVVRYEAMARDLKTKETPQEPNSPNPSPEISGPRSFIQNVFNYFKKGASLFGGGFGGPMMIFSFMMRPGDKLEIHNVREFEDVLHLYNDKLKAFDEVSALSRAGKPLTAEQEKILQNPETIELNKQRLQLVKEHYQFHAMETANEPGSPVLDHLQAHLKADEFGSHFQFGENEVFKDPGALLEFAEDFLGKAYRGELKQGSTFPFLVRTASGDVIGARIRFSPSNDLQNGVSVGPSAPGGRVVIGIEFDQPIGKEGIVETTPGQETLSATRSTGGRNESIRVLPGEKPNTHMMYIIGGAYGPTGKFGIYTVYSGRYAPPITDAAFWGQHAFIEGPPAFQQRITLELGSQLHDSWREPRRKDDGSFEPRIRTTEDKEWIEQHGKSNQVDIANTSFANLPKDWQHENFESARVGIDQVLQAVAEGRPLDPAFLEAASDVIHQEWLKRNGSRASEIQKKDYQDLPEVEKEKDRDIVRRAIQLYSDRRVPV